MSLSKQKQLSLLLEGLKQSEYVLNTLKGKLSPAIDKQDLVSESVVAILDAMKRWDKSRDVKFGTFVCYRVRGAILRFLKKQKCSKMLNESSREMSISDEIDRKYADEGTEARQVVARAIYESLSKKSLTREESIMLELYYFHGQSQGDIATRIVVARSTITSGLAKAIGKLREENNITVGDHKSNGSGHSNGNGNGHY